MSVKDSLLRFLLAAVVVSAAIWGLQFLPQNDYQPSRPLYALAWLVTSIGFYIYQKEK